MPESTLAVPWAGGVASRKPRASASASLAREVPWAATSSLVVSETGSATGASFTGAIRTRTRAFEASLPSLTSTRKMSSPAWSFAGV